MRLVAASAALCGLCSVASADDTAGVYRRLMHYDIRGHDLSHFSASNVNQCGPACDAISDCLSWVFAGRSCWLKSTRDPANLVSTWRDRNKRQSVAGLAAPHHPLKRLQDSPLEFQAYQGKVAGLLSNEHLGTVVEHGIIPQGSPTAPLVMWYELTDTVEECVKLCHQREGCLSFAFVDPDFCYISGADAEAVEALSFKDGSWWQPGTIGYISTPPSSPRNTVPSTSFFPNWTATSISDKVEDFFSVNEACAASNGRECFCPPLVPTWNLNRVSVQQTCAALHGKTMLMTGSSIFRDMWNALGLWLLQADNINVLDLCGSHLHAACFANAQKTLDWLKIAGTLRKKGFLGKAGVTNEYRLCGGGFKLRHMSASKFSQMRDRVPNVLAQGGIDVWVTGGGLHDMAIVDVEDDPKAVTAWANDLVAWATGPFAPPVSLFVSLHRRIVNKVPSRYRHLAEGPMQGNPRIQAWNSIGIEAFLDAGLDAIDMFNVTDSFADDYDGSEDGMHFGLLANHEKLQRILARVVPSVSDRNTQKEL